MIALIAVADDELRARIFASGAFVLEDWGIFSSYGHYVLSGNCYYNPKFHAGEHITTSWVQELVALSPEVLQAKTRSGSTYVLPRALPVNAHMYPGLERPEDFLKHIQTELKLGKI